MDSASHIDPNTLHTSSTGPDGIPTLSAHPVVPQSNNPFTGSTDGSVDSSHTLKPSSVAADPPAAVISDLHNKESKQHSSDSASTAPAATGLRQRVNTLGHSLDKAQDHPAVQNVKGTAQKQVGQLREYLGRSETVRNLEKRLNVDRVVLVAGGVFAYLLLIPLNLFGLALPTTTLLTLIPPSWLALGLLDSDVNNQQNEASTRALLAYFVTLGFIQTLESLMAGLLERKIPQYYTVKLLALAYLLHPHTQGAMKLHQAVFRPLLGRAQAATSPVNTPPQSKEAGFNANSPVGQSFASSQTDNRGKGYVVNEMH